MDNVTDAIDELRALANIDIAKSSQRFFKTKKGEYGYGDIFLGIRVPKIRKIAKKYKNLSLDDISNILQSKYHEERPFGIVLLVNLFQKNLFRDEIYTLYIKSSKYINNWDLIDISAPHIVGKFLIDKNRTILYKLALSTNLWERRVSIVSTFAFIRENQFQDTLKISQILINDSEDLINKAVGWMLREVGKRDLLLLETFLRENYNNIKRVTLRYAIEKFDKKKRQYYLNMGK